jgi:hypothetical protein
MDKSALTDADALLLVSKLSGGCDADYDAAFIKKFATAFGLDPIDVWLQIKPLVIRSRVYVHPSTDAFN